ncbi:GON-4-like protein [Acanthaster planci]|uniref:CASP8-associated protein 2 n=1 Tax=Acanthaster planci TaxID=133434 RepID=A0A8B7ZBF2_ACAPL|nr:GON-4-like protein [Acanthaster planci]
MAETSKRKREECPSSPSNDETDQPHKRPKQDSDQDFCEEATADPETQQSTCQASSFASDERTSDTRLAMIEHVLCKEDSDSKSQTQAQTQETQIPDLSSVSNVGSVDQEPKPLHHQGDDTSIHADWSDKSKQDLVGVVGETQPEASLDRPEAKQASLGNGQVGSSLDCEGDKSCIKKGESDIANLKDTTTSLPTLDTVDMEAVQALTFLKQSASPSKSSEASSARTHKKEEPHQMNRSGTSVYTGSIRRKGFSKGSLAKHHLQKNMMKKLTPARSSADTDSDSQRDSSLSVSPQRMVIDLQPTRKSARQAAREGKEKPWSTMMKRGKKVRLEKKFPKQKDEEDEALEGEGAKKKEKRGRKKGTKGPSLDAAEVQLAKEACDFLEKRLEENAAKNNLSVVNVKNILHHVITNEHVLAMVRNTMEDESTGDKLSPAGPSDQTPVVFEPKMTRAKLKEVSEKSGKVPFVWPVSPVKKPKPQFADLNFPDSDDEDDADYKPSQEDLLKEESDYESTASFGSPCPSTPRSILNTSFLEDLKEEEEMEEESKPPPSSPPETSALSVSTSSPAKGSHIRAIAMPMGPPLPRSRGERLKDDEKLQRELEELDQEIERSEDTIAHRTRSKFPIDKPLEEIEASFVAPDITEDMFDTWDDVGEENEEWVKWLAGLYCAPNGISDCTLVLPNNCASLFHYENEDWAADFDMRLFDRPPQPTLSEMISAQRQAITPRPGQCKSRKAEDQEQQQLQILVFTDGERVQLQQQMQQHVQLLAQMYVLCQGNESLEPHMNQAKLFLTELDMLASRTEATYGGPFTGTGNRHVMVPTSAFRPCNLAGALNITTQEVAVTEKEFELKNPNEAPSEDNSKRKSQCVRSPPTEGAQRIIAHSKVFMYSELLPGLSLTNKPMEKTSFEKSEDVLIVLGLMQYPPEKDKQVLYRMICQNMLPIKTSRQVMVHVKNACSKNSSNVIKNWRKCGIKPILTPPCAPVFPGSEKAPVENFQLYDKRPEWLKKYQSAFYPQQVGASPAGPSHKIAPSTPTPQQEGSQGSDSGKTTPVPTLQPNEPLAKMRLPRQRGPSFSKLEPSTQGLGCEGQLRIHTLVPKIIAPNTLNVKTVPMEAPPQPVLVINPQQGIISTVGGTTVQIITSSTGGFAQVLNHDAVHALTNPASDTYANPTSDTVTKSSDSHSVTPASTPHVSPRLSPSSSISAGGISALQNFQLVKAGGVPNIGQGEKRTSRDKKGRGDKSKQVPSKVPVTKPSSQAVSSRQSTQMTQTISIDETVSKDKSCANSDRNPTAVDNLPPSTTQSSSTPSNKSPRDVDVTATGETLTALKEKDQNISKDTSSPPPRSKSSTPDSLIDEEGAEEDNLDDAAASPGENIVENVDSNSREVSDAEGLPDSQLKAVGDGIVEDASEDVEKASTLTNKMAAKRMKTKLRRDLESTVVLLDSDIVSKDPKREEREMSFSRAYLNKVKERFSSDPDRYVDFLGIFNSFSQTAEIAAEELFQKICQALEGHPDLVEDFTAFLPTDVALECGVLMENLEFAKARLFLRQVEVHFQKNPAQFQKVLNTIMEWGADEDHTNNDLKESILPLLKGQPHLEQEFSLLFADERPPENYMMDFEEIIWDDDKEKEYDSFEEIEIPDSDEEIPITKSRVGRPPNKPASSTQTPSGPKPSVLHRLLPKAALLKGRLPSIWKSPARKKSSTGLKSQLPDPWQELNTQLQYGTQGCACNCHEKSHDTRVQRKVRHCAYCSALGTRTELIRSLRGFTMGNRRRGHLLTASQPPGTSEDNAQSVNPKRGSGRNPSGRKAQKVRWASAGDIEPDIEEEDDGEEEENPYSDAVAHLSEICDNLADYLNENASEEDEEDVEDEKEMDVDDDDVNDDDDADDGQEDDEFEDLEDEEDQDDKEDDEDDDDGADDAVITSEESRGVDGATPESTVSPITSQGSHDSSQSSGHSGNKASPQPTQAAPSSQTTLLGSGVILEGNGSRANSPVTYNEDDRSTEDHMRQLKECLAQEKTGGGESSNPPSVKNLICDETLPESPIRHFSPAGIPTKIDTSVKVEQDVAGQQMRTEPRSPTQMQETVSVVTFAQDSSSSKDGEKDQRSLPRRPEPTKRRVQTVRLAQSPSVSFGQSERVPLFESLAKLRSSPVEIRSSETSSKLTKKDSKEEAVDMKKVQYNEKSGKSEPESLATAKRSSEEDEPTDDSSKNPVSEEMKPDCQKTGGTLLLSAANVDRKDGEVIVVWTRDADRLLLQRCRDQGATEQVFEEIARTLGDKTSKQVSDRFATLMKLFQSASQDDNDDEDDSDDGEEVTSDEDEDG